jgi:hypothetical protein
MADNIVGGLFGMTPELLQAQRNAQLEQQASNFVNNYGDQGAMFGYKLGATLGRGIGGMLGAQDPEMQRIQQRQQMMQGIDINDPQSLLRAAQEANKAGDTPAAQDLYGKYQAAIKNIGEANKTAAEADAKLAEAQSKRYGISAEGRKQELAKTGNFTTESINSFVDGKGDLVRIDKLAKPTSAFVAKAVELGFGDNAEYGQYTKEQVARINAALLEEDIKQKVAGKPVINNLLPGVEKAGDVLGLRKDIQSVTKPYQDRSDAASDAINLADTVLKTNNFAAFSSLARNLATASGEVQISANDTKAFGNDPSLIGSVSDIISTLTSGTPTVDTVKKLRALAVIIKKKADDRLALEEQQLRDTAKASGLFTDTQIDVVFRRRPKNLKTDFTSVADAEAAKLPKGTKITINGRQAVVE